MKGLSDSVGPPVLSAGSSSSCTEKELASEAREQEQAQSVLPKASLWSSFVASTFSVFEHHSNSSATHRSKGPKAATSGWTEAVRRVVASSPMRRLQERILGPKWMGTSASGGTIWLLGVCYKILPEERSDDSISSQCHAEFLQDFSSRIWLTYRKGFEPISELNFTSDVGWGCMLRSGQMLVAQALVFHHLGRSWRRSIEQPFDREYIEILQCFGDSPSQSCPFSIHNLLEAGKAYGLAAGAWLGPYAMCRSWEALARSERDRSMTGNLKCALPMAIYVVSGDEDGERGGAPVICIDDAARLCSDGYIEHGEWGPLLILIPLVLGLEKINPRYIPSLWATFTFPHSLGMVGGKPGASTYMVGVQDDQALYLDPHEVQQVVEICPDTRFHYETKGYPRLKALMVAGNRKAKTQNLLSYTLPQHCILHEGQRQRTWCTVKDSAIGSASTIVCVPKWPALSPPKQPETRTGQWSFPRYCHLNLYREFVVQKALQTAIPLLRRVRMP